MLHQMPGSGRTGYPSYTMDVIPYIKGAYTVYECPTTHPMSDAVNIVSPGFDAKTCFIDTASATACPPVSLCTPFGVPVVPEV